MMILKTAAIVLFVFWIGLNCAKFSELRRWNIALHSLEVGKDNYDFIEGVIWAYEMVMDKKDTRP